MARPYRVPPPAPSDIIRWPADFGTRFLVFVDVEEEFDWTAPLHSENRSVTAMRALPAAHAYFAERGIGLVCMVDHPVASDPAAVDILRAIAADGRSSIGAQLHSWVTPPYAEPMPGDSYAGNLPIELEAAKLDELTALLTDAFGQPPIAYRAGRYGIGPNTVGLLAERGYRIETSIRARYNYTADNGPDFTQIGSAPYRLGSLIELPLTTVFTGGLRRYGSRFYPALAHIPHARGAFARLNLLQRIALTPEDMPIEDVLSAVRVAMDEGQQVLSFSFHSPSLEAGHTPYVRRPADLVRFWLWWDRMIDGLATLGARPATLHDLFADRAGISAETV